MDDPRGEKAKARRAQRILHVAMIVGIGLPLVLFFVLRRR
jgi:hypothetical protein